MTARSANVRIGSNNSKRSTMENLLTRLKSTTTGKRPKTLAKPVRMAIKKRKRKPRAARRLKKRKLKAEKKRLRAREKAKKARRKQKRLQLMK